MQPASPACRRNGGLGQGWPGGPWQETIRELRLHASELMVEPVSGIGEHWMLLQEIVGADLCGDIQ